MAAVSGSEKPAGPWYVSKHLSLDDPPSEEITMWPQNSDDKQSDRSSDVRSSCFRPLRDTGGWSRGLTGSSATAASKHYLDHVKLCSTRNITHVFVREGEPVRVDNGVDEPVQLLQHPRVSQHGVDGPQRRGRADPLPRMDTSKSRENIKSGF